ncbi:MAG: 5-formyltetrahydrofolate cyclo-ligase [Ornithinimicrobium sp.]
MTEPKAARRREVRTARRERLQTGGPQAREADAQALADHGMAWLTRGEPAPRLPRCVTAYDSMATEPPVDALIARLTQAGVRVLVPITLGEGRLRWRDADPEVSADPLRPAEHDGPSWGEEILEEVDAALLPALAVGRDGTRLGQGGGYYDRWVPALRAVRPDAEVIAVVYAEEFGGVVPRHPHDICVDAVISPDGQRRVSRPEPASDETRSCP